MAATSIAMSNSKVFQIILGLSIFAAILLYWKDELPLLFNSEGFQPNGQQRLTVLALLGSLPIILILLQLTLSSVKADYRQYAEQQKELAKPPPRGPIEVTRECYEQRDFHRKAELGEIDGAPNAELWLGEPDQQNELNWYSRPGALLFNDGSITQFSVALLYDEDAWAVGELSLIHI